MATAYSERVSNGRGELVEGSSLTHLAAGTMVSRDLEAAKRFYENFLGLETVRYADDRMLLRDRRAKYLMEHGEHNYFVIDVQEVAQVEKPQKMLNHWGVSVGSHAEVERIHVIAKAEADRYWIKKVRPITTIHNSYGFMLIDQDDNWWEIEHRSGRTNDFMFSGGDFDNPTRDDAKKVDPDLPIAQTPAEVVGAEAFLTHGTVDVAEVANARQFYEDVLGLRSVRHYENAQFTAGGGDFAFVGVQIGTQIADQSTDNRWVLLVQGEEKLLAMHANAVAKADQYRIRHITDPARDDEGNLSFMIYSADANWFEFSTRSGNSYATVFEQDGPQLGLVRATE
jgi:catechol 2,3-dioxygenase-like lactoylglutathione lyase family enzyme